RCAEETCPIVPRIEEHDVVRVDEVDREKPRLALRRTRCEALEEIDGLRCRHAVVAEAGPGEAGMLAIEVVFGKAVGLQGFRGIRESTRADLLIDDAEVPLSLVRGEIALLAQHRSDCRNAGRELDTARRTGRVCPV